MFRQEGSGLSLPIRREAELDAVDALRRPEAEHTALLEQEVGQLDLELLRVQVAAHAVGDQLVHLGVGRAVLQGASRHHLPAGRRVEAHDRVQVAEHLDAQAGHGGHAPADAVVDDGGQQLLAGADLARLAEQPAEHLVVGDVLGGHTAERAGQQP